MTPEEEDAVAKVTARLTGRVDIKYVPESIGFYESFELRENGDADAFTVVQHRHCTSREEAWLQALSRARGRGRGVIFGPDGHVILPEQLHDT